MQRIKRLLLVATLMAMPGGWVFAAPAQACVHDACAAINAVCQKVVKQDCLG